MKRRIFGLALVLLLSGLSPALQRDAIGDDYTTVTVKWEAPATGSPAVRYLVRIRDLDGTLYETTMVDAAPGPLQTYTFTHVEYAHRYQARVAGIDARGRQGPWTSWSTVYDRETSVPQP